MISTREALERLREGNLRFILNSVLGNGPRTSFPQAAFDRTNGGEPFPGRKRPDPGGDKSSGGRARQLSSGEKGREHPGAGYGSSRACTRIDRLPLRKSNSCNQPRSLARISPSPSCTPFSKLSDEELRRGLTHLQAAEFLSETSLFPDLEYTFKHALTHEVAYGSLLHERQRALHAQIVEAIETQYSTRLIEHVERLAHRAARGEVGQKKEADLRQAGAKADARSANARSGIVL